MIKNIPLSIDATDRTMIIPRRIVLPVIHYDPSIFKGSLRRFGSGIYKSVAFSGRINKVIGIPHFSG
jgi:hypothetical protein